MCDGANKSNIHVEPKFVNDRGGAFNNFDRVRDRKSDGHVGPPCFDGLVYEMIRGAADFLALKPDPALEKRIDGYIARIAAAQDRDTNGYLNTWTQLEHPNRRWGLNGGDDGYQHEMYNVGDLCEAAVHYYEATSKTRLLGVAVKLANYTCEQIGPSPKFELIPNHDNGGGVRNLFIPPGTEFEPEFRRELLGGVTVLHGTAPGLFRTGVKQVISGPFQVTAVSYYVNANRGTCEMQKWMPEHKEACSPLNQE